MSNTYYCDECGEPYRMNEDGASTHVSSSGDIDYDADADHTPYGEEPHDEDESGDDYNLGGDET